MANFLLLINSCLLIGESDASRQKGDLASMIASLSHEGSPTSSEYRYQSSANSNSNSNSHSNLDWRLKLDEAGGYELEWSVEYEANEIVFAININKSASNFAEGSDLFALGFSRDGRPSSSDFCLVWYDLAHQARVQDARTDASNRLSLGPGPPEASQCRLRAPSRGHGRAARRHRRGRDAIARVAFSRPLDVCNSNDFYIIDNGTTHLVWFALKGPLLSIEGLDLDASERANYQANGGGGGNASANNRLEYGMKRVQLVAVKPATAKTTTTTQTPTTATTTSANFHDVRMDKFQIPAEETTYECKLIKLPAKFEARRFHITRYEAVIDRSNAHVVHHMELFNCANLNSSQELELSDLYGRGGGWSGACNSVARPKITQFCRKVVMAWAMGAQPLVYPEQVGQSIGGPGYSPFVVLEVHYNNIGAAAGLVDSSGLRFHYTAQLRPFDAGILEVGLEYTDKNSIPPRMVTPLAGFCPSQCTRVGLAADERGAAPAGGPEEAEPADGIHVFAAQLHTHLTGIASWTEQVREGRLVRELQRDDHYSPHFQEIRLLPEPVHVLPGDALIHYCLYDTRKRQNVTLGGFATSDEMCVTYLHYYPRRELEVCKSSIETDTLEAYFAHLAANEAQATSERLDYYDARQTERPPRDGAASLNGTGRAKSVSENYQSIEWSARRSEELIQLYAKAPLSIQCNRSDGRRFSGHWNGIEPTRLWPLEPASGKVAVADMLAAGAGAGASNWAAAPGPRWASEYRGRDYLRRHARCSRH